MRPIGLAPRRSSAGTTSWVAVRCSRAARPRTPRCSSCWSPAPTKKRSLTPSRRHRATRAPTPMRSPTRCAASPRDSSPCRTATCTRPTRWWPWWTSSGRRACWRRSRGSSRRTSASSPSPVPTIPAKGSEAPYWLAACAPRSQHVLANQVGTGLGLPLEVRPRSLGRCADLAVAVAGEPLERPHRRGGAGHPQGIDGGEAQRRRPAPEELAGRLHELDQGLHRLGAADATESEQQLPHHLGLLLLLQRTRQQHRQRARPPPPDAEGDLQTHLRGPVAQRPAQRLGRIAAADLGGPPGPGLTHPPPPPPQPPRQPPPRAPPRHLPRHLGPVAHPQR